MNIPVVPGGSVVLRYRVRKPTGGFEDLTNASVDSKLITAGFADATVVIQPGSTPEEKLAIVTGEQTRARPGRVLRVRSIITLFDSIETPAADTLISVGT